jgi:hypothetical protein
MKRFLKGKKRKNPKVNVSNFDSQCLSGKLSNCNRNL